MSRGNGRTPGGEAPFLAAITGTTLSGTPGPTAVPLPSGPTIESVCSGAAAPRPTAPCASTPLQGASAHTGRTTIAHRRSAPRQTDVLSIEPPATVIRPKPRAASDRLAHIP